MKDGKICNGDYIPSIEITRTYRPITEGLPKFDIVSENISWPENAVAHVYWPCGDIDTIKATKEEILAGVPAFKKRVYGFIEKAMGKRDFPAAIYDVDFISEGGGGRRAVAIPYPSHGGICAIDYDPINPDNADELSDDGETPFVLGIMFFPKEGFTAYLKKGYRDGMEDSVTRATSPNLATALKALRDGWNGSATGGAALYGFQIGYRGPVDELAEKYAKSLQNHDEIVKGE